jgi:hypothetical protein
MERRGRRGTGRAMTAKDLGALLEQYRAGLERQRTASEAGDLEGVNRAADERDRFMAGLVAVEDQVRQARQILSQSREEASALPDYAETAALHMEAVGLVTRILKTDMDSRDSLAAAELARRDKARAVEQGETTLAAYRKVMTLPPGATLVDRRG